MPGRGDSVGSNTHSASGTTQLQNEPRNLWPPLSLLSLGLPVSQGP